MRWLGDVCSDLKVMDGENWMELVLNRNACRDVVKKVKTYEGL
jgi:hypothetical protein